MSRQPLLNAIAQSDVDMAGFYIKRAGGRLLLASGYDAPTDSNLDTGGGTDATEELQTILDIADDGVPIVLVLDGAALVTGLDVWSNTTIWCLPGAGFFQKADSNRPILRNKHPSRTATIDKGICLLGGVYHGNQAEQAHHVTNGAETGSWTVPLGFFGIDNLVMRDLTVRNPRTFGIHIARWSRVRMDNCHQELPTPGTTPEALNQDFLHFNGPGRFAHLTNITGKSWDDFIAFNADDGVGVNSVTNELGPYVGEGAITDVTIRGVRMDDSLFGIRLLSKTSRIDRFTISDVKGTTRGHYLLMDTFPDGSAYNAAQPGNFGTVSIEDVDVQPHDQIFTDLAVQIGGKFDKITLDGLHKSNLNAVNGNYGFIVINTLADIGQLMIDGLTINDTGTLDREATAEIIVQGKVDRLRICDTDWLRAGTVNRNGTLVAVKDATSDVGLLTLNGVSANRVTNLVSVLAGGTLREMRAVNVTVDDPAPGSALLYTAANLPVAPALFTASYRGPKLLSGPGDYQPVCSSSDTDRLIILTDGDGDVTMPTATGVFERATVTRTAPGAFHVEFGEYLARYSVSIIASNDNTSQKLASLAGNLSAITTDEFYFAVSGPDGNPADAAVILVSLHR